MPFRILKIKFPKGAWRKPLFYYDLMSFNIFRIEILNINIYKNLIVLNQLKCFFIIFHIVVDFEVFFLMA